MKFKYLVLAAALAPAAVSAQTSSSAVTPLNLINTTYSQNFDTLAQSGSNNSALPTGFQISETGSSSAVDGQYAAGTGSANGGNVYSFGLAGSSDRALGTLFSGSNSPSFGAVFRNGLGSTITSLSFDFFGEQWRAGDAGTDRLAFQYLIGGTNILGTGWTSFSTLDIVSLVNSQSPNGALNGNDAANRARYTGTINLNLLANQTIAIRWVDIDGTPGADHGLALDDFNMTANLAAGAVPEPATWAMMMLGFGAMGFAMRRRPTASARIRFA